MLYLVTEGFKKSVMFLWAPFVNCCLVYGNRDLYKPISIEVASEKNDAWSMFHGQWCIIVTSRVNYVPATSPILIAVPVVFSRRWTSYAGVLKMPRVSNAFKFTHNKKRNSITVHSNTCQLALQIWRLSKVRTGWPYGWFWKVFDIFR